MNEPTRMSIDVILVTRHRALGLALAVFGQLYRFFLSWLTYDLDQTESGQPPPMPKRAIWIVGHRFNARRGKGRLARLLR